MCSALTHRPNSRAQAYTLGGSGAASKLAVRLSDLAGQAHCAAAPAIQVLGYSREHVQSSCRGPCSRLQDAPCQIRVRLAVAE